MNLIAHGECKVCGSYFYRIYKNGLHDLDLLASAHAQLDKNKNRCNKHLLEITEKEIEEYRGKLMLLYKNKIKGGGKMGKYPGGK